MPEEDFHLSDRAPSRTHERRRPACIFPQRPPAVDAGHRLLKISEVPFRDFPDVDKAVIRRIPNSTADVRSSDPANARFFCPVARKREISWARPLLRAALLGKRGISGHSLVLVVQTGRLRS